MQQTPKENAEELVAYFSKILRDSNADSWTQQAKNLAKNHCDYHIMILDLLHKPEYVTFDIKDTSGDWYNGYSLKEYYEQVKLEIDKL